MGPQRNQMRQYRRVRTAFRVRRREEGSFCNCNRRNEGVVRQSDRGRGRHNIRESETKGREGRVESCELDQLHGRLRHTLPKCTFGSAAHSLRHYDAGRPNHAHGGGGGRTHSTETGGRDSQKRPNSLTASLTGWQCVSLMSELLNATGRSRGVNAPFACLDLAPSRDPVPGVRLTISRCQKTAINPSSTLPRTCVVGCTVLSAHFGKR